MDHETALATQAVERYLLRELTQAEAEDFEGHFFTCRECAAAVNDGQQLMRELRDEATRPDDTPDSTD